MQGYRDGGAAVEFYKGGWILRAPLPGDLPLSDNPAAAAAFADWMRRNRAKIEAQNA